MLLRLCQLKSQPLITLLILFLSSCSWQKNPGHDPSELMAKIPNDWFKVNPNHSLISLSGMPAPHLLFDIATEFSASSRMINAIIATPEGSPHAYTIDLSSGQRHYSHSYCKQKDVWGTYSGTIDRPPFSIGFVPHILDQLGEPQKIIIWTNGKSFTEDEFAKFTRVKLIGAYVEQTCPYGNCIGKSNWLSRLVFIAVNVEDKSADKILTISEFKKKFDWEASKAYLENIEGRNFIGDVTYPAIRIGQLIEYEEALQYFNKRTIFLSSLELKKIQKGCHALYDKLWDDVGKKRPEDRSSKTIEELTDKVKLKESLKQQKMPVGFAARFKVFTRKYFKETSICEKFVYHGNINQDPEAFWFLSYVGIFYRLHREGYSYDCNSSNWGKNNIDDMGSHVADIKEMINKCNERQLDQAMNYLPNFLNTLKSESDFYRFIDYDNHSFGTHRKIYSWIKSKTRKFDCSKDPNVAILKEIKIIPEDVEWKKKDVIDIEDEMKIIYE